MMSLLKAEIIHKRPKNTTAVHSSASVQQEYDSQDPAQRHHIVLGFGFL